MQHIYDFTTNLSRSAQIANLCDHLMKKVNNSDNIDEQLYLLEFIKWLQNKIPMIYI